MTWRHIRRTRITATLSQLAVACTALLLPSLAHSEPAGSTLRSLQAGWLDAGGLHSCAIGFDGTATCWGNNFEGELGDGTTISRARPVEVKLPIGRRATALSSGFPHVCAVLDDGSAACWGDNDSGQLGNGTLTRSSTPTAVRLPVGRKAVTISAGRSHSCATLDDGAVACWGSNSIGQIGVATTAVTVTLPAVVRLPAGRRATAVTVGANHSCALLDDGGLSCWGSNSHGELGDGTEVGRNTPVAVKLPSGDRAVAISGGLDHTCAVLAGGPVSCWGDNARGQLGDGGNARQLAPVVVGLPAGSRATAVSAGSGFTCAILDSGSASCWGDNGTGTLGDGTKVGRVTPVAVKLPVGRRALAISAGHAHACGVLDDGSALCWGNNDFGQRGDGVASDRSDPSVGGVTLPANSISRVANLSVAIEQTPATLTVGQPGQLVVRVTNAGPDPSTGANINVTSGILVVTGYGPSQGTVAGQTWMTQSIASGGQATLVVNLSSPTAGTGTLNAEVVTAAEADPNSTPGNHLPTEDDQKTVQIAVLPPVPPVNPPPVPPVRQLPSGLTLSGTRVRNVVTLTGALGVPAGGTCGGTILAAARIAGQVRSTHTNLRQSASGCTYKTRLRLPGRGRGRVRATVIFTGNGTLLPIASSQLRVP